MPDQDHPLRQTYAIYLKRNRVAKEVGDQDPHLRTGESPRDPRSDRYIYLTDALPGEKHADPFDSLRDPYSDEDAGEATDDDLYYA